jgi:cytochrome bd-type quinol oxidase subunit 1
VAVSIGLFAALYLILAVVDFALMVRYARRAMPPAPEGADPEAAEPVPAVQY